MKTERMRDPAVVARAIVSELSMLHEPRYGTRGMFRACCVDDLVVVADDVVLTSAERELVARGRADRVRADRVAFQYVIGPMFSSLVERAAGRSVLAFSGEVHLEALFEVAVFRLAPEGDPPRAAA